MISLVIGHNLEVGSLSKHSSKILRKESSVKDDESVAVSGLEDVSSVLLMVVFVITIGLNYVGGGLGRVVQGWTGLFF